MEKERRTKALLLSTLVVVVATLSIAFAAMSRTLSINGIGKMDTASWSVYFDNLSNATTVRGAKEVSKPNISTIDNGILENIKVKLSNPKDEISYTVDIVNDGTIDAEITMIKNIELTDAQKKIFEFKVTYTDTGDVLKDGDLLPAGKTKNITITIRFKDDITEFDLPTESQTINLSYQITYTQYDGGNSDLPIGPNTGGGVTTEKAVLATNKSIEELFEMDDPMIEPFFNGTLPRSQVESIDFLNSNIVPSEYASVAWDASLNKDGTVMAWYTDSDNNELYEVYIGGNGGVAAPSNSSALFTAFMSLKNINFNGNFDTSNVIDFSYMFYACFVLTSLDLSSFNTSNVTTMENMFSGVESILKLDLSNFDTSNVTNMYGMFDACRSVTELILENWDTSNVTNMELMFNSCNSITMLDLSHFDTSNVTNMISTFENCESLSVIKLNNADFSNVVEAQFQFSVGADDLIFYVRDEAAKQFILSYKNDANVIIEPLNS